jgi:signal transduction histidine kinase/CheY-like chemotaxis protein
MKARNGKKIAEIVLIGVVNALAIASSIVVFVVFNNNSVKKLNEQNLNNVTNINASSASIASSFLLNRTKILQDIKAYSNSQNFNSSDLLTFLNNSNSDEDVTYELIDKKYKGYATDKSLNTGLVQVDYSSDDYYNLKQIFASAGEIGSSSIYCTPEFTEAYTAVKCFAPYTYLSLDNEGVKEYYTLLSVSKSSTFSALFDNGGDYEDTATVLVDKNSNYLFGNSAFKGTSLFNYFYKYNNLTLDEKNKLYSDFASSTQGTYYYKDSLGRDCVFVYKNVSSTDFAAVTEVPLSSYHSTNFDTTYSIIVTSILSCLFLFDIWYFALLNRRNRISAEKEKEASMAKTDFLSRMSHDIRTPLNVIIGTSQLAEKENNSPKTCKYLSDIDQSSHFLLALVNDILDLNKVEAGKMELNLVPYSYIEFKDSISAIIEPLCEEKGIQFTIQGNEENTNLMLDKVRINQIFYNILSNSVKFTPKGGHISLNCHVTDIDGENVRMDLIAKDDGSGMSEDFQKHMFEAFSQENRSQYATQGTGLGLAIVKNLVSLMKGKIEVQSEIDKGTSFHIILPSVRAPEAVENKKKEKINTAMLNGMKVLLCEDNALNAEIAKTFMESSGMNVVLAADGKIGLSTFSFSKPNEFDVILMDMRMPNMNGVEAAKAIRELNRPDAKTIPIIAMTANAYDEDIQTCKEAGMNAHISKPVDYNLLFQTIIEETEKETK